MKARVFLLAILATALILLSLGLGGWWIILQDSVLSQQGQQLHLPTVARFIPRTAFMSFHLLTTPEWAEQYARAVALPQQRAQVEQTIANIRNEVFLQAGLDYPNELKNWIGDESSLALFSSSNSGEDRDWLLALNSRNIEASRHFLQRFWDARQVNNSEIKIKNYRGVGLISGKGVLPGQQDKSFATALIDNSVLLIASSPTILQEALDVSQIDELNQAHDPDILDSILELENGVILFVARPDAVRDLLGLSNDYENFPGVVATLMPVNHTLSVDSIFHFDDQFPVLTTVEKNDLFQGLGGEIRILAFSNGPNLLNDTATIENYPWLVTIVNTIKDTILQSKGSFFSSIVEETLEPFVWAETSEGWLLGTSVNNPDPLTLTNILTEQALVEAPLSSYNTPTKIWTHLEANNPSSKSNNGKLEASLIGARQESNNLAWWAQNLEVLKNRRDNPRAGLALLTQLESLKARDTSYGVVLTSKPAQTLIAKWKPWFWIQKLSQQLISRVQGLTINICPINENTLKSRKVNIKASIMLD